MSNYLDIPIFLSRIIRLILLSQHVNNHTSDSFTGVNYVGMLAILSCKIFHFKMVCSTSSTSTFHSSHIPSCRIIKLCNYLSQFPWPLNVCILLSNFPTSGLSSWVHLPLPSLFHLHCHWSCRLFNVFISIGFVQ